MDDWMDIFLYAIAPWTTYFQGVYQYYAGLYAEQDTINDFALPTVPMMI